MRFLFDADAGKSELEIKGDSFKHLKARRVRVGERLELRNLRDGLAYEYEVTELSRCAALRLEGSKALAPDPATLALAWAVVDEQSVEKTLPALNELGVAKIIFVYSDFSQRDVKLDLARFERILTRSSEQCGRNGIIKFEIAKSSDFLAAKYASVALIDFGGKDLDEYISNLNDKNNSNLIFYVGAEGGFSERERELFPLKFGLKSKNILRSVTAIVAVAAKVLA